MERGGSYAKRWQTRSGGAEHLIVVTLRTSADLAATQRLDSMIC